MFLGVSTVTKNIYIVLFLTFETLSQCTEFRHSDTLIILWEGLLLSALTTVTSPHLRRNFRSRCPWYCDQSFQTLPWETRGQVFTKTPRAPFLPSVRRQGYQQSSLTAAPGTWSVTLSLSTLFTVLCQSTELHPFLRKYVGWKWFHFFLFF